MKTKIIYALSLRCLNLTQKFKSFKNFKKTLSVIYELRHNDAKYCL